jgi:hypothetical protein
VGVEFDDVVVRGKAPSTVDLVSMNSAEAAVAAKSPTAEGIETDWDLPERGEILIDAPPGGWEGVVSGEAI